MSLISRRRFLGTTAMGIGSAVMASHLPAGLTDMISPNPASLPIGFQVWTVREALIKDFPGTLRKMAALGYQSVEMCSPPGYESSGFGPLMKLKAKEMKQIINDAGLIFPSSHYGMNEFREHPDKRIEFALESGQTQMVLSSFGLPKNATSDDWKKAADELNKVGLKAKNAGIQMGFHNHHGEFEKIDGILIYELLLKQFDPELVKMQFQVAVINIGYKAQDYFRKYPGRFFSAHLADWSEEKKAAVPVGQGIVDWKDFFASINTGGVKTIFVEMSEECFKPSADFLKGI